jgi:ribosomal-protein-alanine N-acetyltransferase
MGLRRDKNEATVKIREVRRRDWPAIEVFASKAPFTSLPMWDWRAFLTDASCVLSVERDRICGILFASADEAPVAWVRLAAVEGYVDIGRWLDLSLPKLLEGLRGSSVREVAWMDYQGWARPYLFACGFRPLADVITLSKTDSCAPAVAAPDASLRSARKADRESIVGIDRAAFRPYWWRSEETLGRRAAAASRFTVAEREGRVIGYIEWELHLPAAHVNRIAVRPDDQGQGVGRLLLRDAIEAVWQSGAREISLNTPRQNCRARRLYDAFGFRPTGDVAKVWALRF